jgi:ArsR family transcriptional regulator, lead/cadmium/zinc/bismuth-responsive transcriptional repressor
MIAHVSRRVPRPAAHAKAPSEALDEDDAARLAELFRALGDASRLRILAVVAGAGTGDEAAPAGGPNVGAIARAVGISESAVSHHLRGLRQMRLVRARKRGREVFYALNDAHVTALFAQGLEHIRHG